MGSLTAIHIRKHTKPGRLACADVRGPLQRGHFPPVAVSLAVQLYGGSQFAQTRCGKQHHLAQITDFFRSLGILFPAFNAHFVSGLEFIGGLMPIAGLAPRLAGLRLSATMFVAYWTADHEALLSVFSDPGKFYGADPNTFLFASVLFLILGAGYFSLDAAIAKSWRKVSCA
jgi:putative oxidoreductase